MLARARGRHPGEERLWQTLLITVSGRGAPEQPSKPHLKCPFPCETGHGSCRQTQSLHTAISQNSLHNTGTEHTCTQKSQERKNRKEKKGGREWGEATSAYRTKLAAKYETFKCTSKLKRELLWEVKETLRVDYDTLDIISLYSSKKSVS